MAGGSPYLAVGVDIAEPRKGLDLVALDTQRQVVASRGGLSVIDTSYMILEELRPAIVCIDSPSGWALTGRSRLAERELARRGIQAYATPQDPGDHPFYRWMREGISLYCQLESVYPLFRGSDPSGTAAEVFPNASAVLLAGRRRRPEESKAAFRRLVLRQSGVDDLALPTTDRVDAALGALTGVLAIEEQWQLAGDSAEGVILLPPATSPALPVTPTTPVRAATSSGTHLDQAVTVGHCGCGCGSPVRRRFLPGHDAKLKSALLTSWRSGDPEAGRRLGELGWLPPSISHRLACRPLTEMLPEHGSNPAGSDGRVVRDVLEDPMTSQH